MRVVVIGCGHVGLVTAATLAKIGHDVAGLDDDRAKIDLLKQGRAPFYEPGLQELVDEVVGSGKLRFAGDPSEAVPGVEVAFICVGTPARPDGEANLIAVESAAAAVGKHATGDVVVVQKSTVPVQTAERVRTMLAQTSKHTFHLVSNPEFLREGSAVQDSLHPERILAGSDYPEGHEVIRKLYEPLIGPRTVYHSVDLRTAELAKHACNAFLALKISYANALARICEASGADVAAVADIMGSDPRIGRAFLDAGLGYGGYCFPKDVAAFKAQAGRLGYDFGLLDEVMKINQQAVESAFAKVKDALWNLESKRVALLGLAFKPGTDDVREAPALYLAQKLLDAGATVVGYDPQANENAKAELPGIETSDDPYAAAEGAHCVVVCTEWPELRALDLPRLKGILTRPIIVDARNLLDPEKAAEAGFTYVPTGRPPVNL
jgi:UDPglucose 6-dehydrogenase